MWETNYYLMWTEYLIIILRVHFRHTHAQIRKQLRVPVIEQQKGIQLGTRKLWVRSLALLNGLRILHYCELWYRSQMWLGSGISVTVVRSAASSLIRPLPWGSPCTASMALKGQKRKKRNQMTGNWIFPWTLLSEHAVTLKYVRQVFNDISYFLILFSQPSTHWE